MKNKFFELLMVMTLLTGCELNFGGGSKNTNSSRPDLNSTNIVVDRYGEGG